jgi:hypothetical protein
MPFRSQHQADYFYANKDELEKQGVNVDEWAKDTDWSSLPDKVPSKRKTKSKPKSRLRKAQ